MYDFQRLERVSSELDAFYIDCTITVALKIIDNSCKMHDYEKSLFLALYDALIPQKSEFFTEDVFEIISYSRKIPNKERFSIIKVLREDAMKMITRPKMKAFKAFIRQQVLI